MSRRVQPRSLIQVQHPVAPTSYLLQSPHQLTLAQVKDCLLDYAENWIHNTAFMTLHGAELQRVLTLTIPCFKRGYPNRPVDLERLRKMEIMLSRASRFARRCTDLQLPAAGDDYKIVSQLPVNSCFGSVYLAQLTKSPEKGIFVIKRSSKKRMYNVCYKSVQYEDPLKEVWINQQLVQHIEINGGMDKVTGAKYLCLVHDSRDDQKNNELWSISKFMAGGDLFQYLLNLSEEKKMDESHVKKLFFQILCGVYFFHSVLPTPHAINDISLENVLLNENAQNAFICDFATACEVPAENNRVQFPTGKAPGKSNYHSYELLSGRAYNPLANDMFALGVCLWMMLSRVPAFDRATSGDERFRLIQQGRLHDLIRGWNLSMSNEAVDLVNKLLSNESERATIEQALLHPFLAEQMFESCGNDPASVYYHMQRRGGEYEVAVNEALQYATCANKIKANAQSSSHTPRPTETITALEHDNSMDFDQKVSECMQMHPSHSLEYASPTHSPFHESVSRESVYTTSNSNSSSSSSQFCSQFEYMLSESSSSYLSEPSCSSASVSPAKQMALPLPTSSFNMTALQAQWRST